MLGVALMGDREVRLVDVSVPSPGPGDVLIEVKAAAVCGSDVHYYRSDASTLGQRRGKIIGHEGSGVVKQVGPGVSGVRPGDRVATYHYLGCGHCRHCVVGQFLFCQSAQGQAIAGRGADAEYMLLPARNVIPLPSSISYVDASFVACNAATAYGALLRLGIGPGSNLIVTGLGPVGLATVILARALGVRVLGSDPVDARRDLARTMGADVHDPATTPLSEAVRRWRGVDEAVTGLDASGSAVAQESLVGATSSGGTVALVGHGRDPMRLLGSDLVYRQITVAGSTLPGVGACWALLAFMASTRTSFHPAVTHQVDLRNAEDAFKLADSQEVGKVVLMDDRVT